MAGAYFKKYNRDYRTQKVEETFEKGVVFTRAPLETGKNRMLINFDIINDGEALANRKGYRTNVIGLPLSAAATPSAFSSNVFISAGREVVETDNKRYRTVVASCLNEDDMTPISGTNLYSAKSEFWTMNNPAETQYDIFSEYDIKTCDLTTLSLSGAEHKSYFSVPIEAEVHGLHITNKAFTARLVGTYAFGNAFYSFNDNSELVRVRYDEDNTKYIQETMTAKEINISEAMSYGFNMLSTDPFTFTDSFEAGVIQLEGLMVYKDDTLDIPVPEPLINQEYYLRCNYKIESGAKYKIVWDWREEGNTEYTKISSKEIQYTQSESVTVPDKLLVKFKGSIENTIIRVRAYKYNSESSKYDDDPEKTITIGITFAKVGSDNIANRDLKNYDLSKAAGMTYWKSHLFLFGLSAAPTVLFMSDINEPTYFPYPNNIDIFDEPIINVVSFNEYLLVFTKSQIIQISLNESGAMTKKVLQGSLDFQDYDARFIQVIKNMVFFKSGGYYYMIVPKTLSVKDELAIAPVSRNIDYFLDEFETNITNLIDMLYDYDVDADPECTWDLINHYNYLNYEDVHNVYVIKLNKTNLLLNVDLLYNTVDRTWRLYCYESQSVYLPLKEDATKAGVLIAPIEATLNTDNTNTTLIGVQFLETSRDIISDWYLPKTTVVYKTDDAYETDDGRTEALFEDTHTYKNWQVLDSGYRDDVVDYNKRYRELQIKFNNISSKQLNFITEFLLDGDIRVNKYVYATEHNVDPSSPNYGIITITRTPIENMSIPGETILSVEEPDINAWTLDNSHTPELAFWKARLKVSGKGYTPRFRLISRNEARFEVLGYTWVYRQLYSR